jgi:hypothetical protein
MWRRLVGLLQPSPPAPADDPQHLRVQVEEELDAALAAVARVAPVALERQRPRLEALRAAWAAQAARLRARDHMPAGPEAAQPGRRALAELLAVLTWVRELASMLRLAARTGAPVARVEELMAQMAAAAAGLSAAHADRPVGGGT